MAYADFQHEVISSDPAQTARVQKQLTTNKCLAPFHKEAPTVGFLMERHSHCSATGLAQAGNLIADFPQRTQGEKRSLCEFFFPMHG